MMMTEPDYKQLSKNLADVLYKLRECVDDYQNLNVHSAEMCAVDAALEQYEDLMVQQMELEREGLLDIVIYGNKVYYRIQYTRPYTYSIWWHRVKENTTSLLKMVEDNEMVKKLETAFNNDIASIRNFEKCKKTAAEYVKWVKENPDKNPLDWRKPQKDDFVNKMVDELKGQTLTDIVYDWWDDCFTVNSNDDSQTSIQDLVSRIEKWLPKEQSAAGSQNAYVDCSVEGYNDCLKQIKSKLRNKE